MTKLYAFDFDGTLTTRDTLLEFIRYACGTPRFLLGFLIHSPLLVLMKLRLYPNGRTKEGIVIRPQEPIYSPIIGGCLSMKVINNDYLVKKCG